MILRSPPFLKIFPVRLNIKIPVEHPSNTPICKYSLSIWPETMYYSSTNPQKSIDSDRTFNYDKQGFGRLVIHTEGCVIPSLQNLVPEACVGLSRKLDVAVAQWDYTGFGNLNLCDLLNAQKNVSGWCDDLYKSLKQV